MGKQVQAFKKGPDYIDPMWLGRAAKRHCYNLDFYTMQKSEIVDKFSQHMAHADIGLIEGNKGLYDGLDLDGSNSNAALAGLLDAPVILVIDSRGMTRGIAPLVLGYQAFDKDINIQGVILNQVGGSRHEGKLRAILEHYTDVSVLGAIHKDEKLNIDERHLGLIPSNEENLADLKISYIAKSIKDQVNLDQLVSIADSASMPVNEAEIVQQETCSIESAIRIGIFRDEAFGFYYPDDLESMQECGVQIVEINSIHDDTLPSVDGLFIGGGFPETMMAGLHANVSLRESVKESIEAGMPVYAECGGLMYLCRSISWNNKAYDMVGAIEADIVMEKTPQGRGYIQLQETEQHPWGACSISDTIFAHEFHYSRLVNIDRNYDYAYKVLRGTGIDGEHDGLVYKNLLANYGHLRNTRKNQWVKRFIDYIISKQYTRHTLALSSQSQ